MLQTLHYSIHEVEPYISWSYFFHAWGFPARFAGIADIHGCDSCRAMWLARFPQDERARAAEAMQLHKEAQRMLFYLDQQGYRIHVRFGLFDCNSQGEDILIGQLDNLPLDTSAAKATVSPAAPSHLRLGVAHICAKLPPPPPPELSEGLPAVFRLNFLRQQSAPFLCLADFLRPVNPEGLRDRIGIFCTAADEAIEHLYEDGTEQADEYRHLLCQTLADRLAEAATERAHQAIRRHYWGYAPDEELSIHDLLAERFRGIRPAVGYPCLPDQSLNFDLDRLIDFSAVGIRLTENGAMLPHASVSGLMISHPEAHYFAVGTIGEDQFLDYAQRKGRKPEELRPYLTANLL